jgi:hypothetical protein
VKILPASRSGMNQKMARRAPGLPTGKMSISVHSLLEREQSNLVSAVAVGSISNRPKTGKEIGEPLTTYFIMLT